MRGKCNTCRTQSDKLHFALHCDLYYICVIPTILYTVW